jgi:outer membrane protein
MKKTLTSIIIGLACATASVNLYAEDLLTVYQQAMASDPVVLKASAQFEISKEDIVNARSVLLPKISGEARYADVERDYLLSNSAGDNLGVRTRDSDTKSWGLNLSMEVYHHATWLRLDNAKKAAHRSDLAYQLAKQDVIVRVSRAYFNILSAKDDKEFATAEKVAIERQLEQTKQRFAVGLTAITDVHEAQAQFDNAVTDEIRAENAIYHAEEDLRVITNVYPKNVDKLNTQHFSTSRPMPDSANEWQQLAENKSLDLISEKISVDIAKENINIARAGHYPTVDFNGGISSNDEGSNSGLGGPDNYSDWLDTQSLSLTLNVPIYSGGSTSSSVRKAQQNYVVASQDLALIHRGVVRDSRNAYNTVIADISAIKALGQAVISAEKALEATEAGFEVGTRTIVDVLNSTRNLYNAKRNLSSTRYGYIQNVLALKRAAGTINEQDISDINKGLSAAN